jgi:DNA polymerase sigma
MQFIPHARVPVLQYVSSHFGISCDISIDNNAGRIKSKVFYWVNTLDERFGDMVLLVRSILQSYPFLAVHRYCESHVFKSSD